MNKKTKKQILEDGEDLYVDNYDYVAFKILEKLTELGVIKVENE